MRYVEDAFQASFRECPSKRRELETCRRGTCHRHKERAKEAVNLVLETVVTTEESAQEFREGKISEDQFKERVDNITAKSANLVESQRALASEIVHDIKEIVPPEAWARIERDLQEFEQRYSRITDPLAYMGVKLCDRWCQTLDLQWTPRMMIDGVLNDLWFEHELIMLKDAIAAPEWMRDTGPMGLYQWTEVYKAFTSVVQPLFSFLHDEPSDDPRADFLKVEADKGLIFREPIIASPLDERTLAARREERASDRQARQLERNNGNARLRAFVPRDLHGNLPAYAQLVIFEARMLRSLNSEAVVV